MVSVELGSRPLDGARVGISQVAPFGLRLELQTNESGRVGIALGPGQYGVSVSDPRFSLQNSVPVYPGNMTRMQVTVNRTSSYAGFAAAKDSTTSGEIETWNQLVVEVANNGRPYSEYGRLVGLPLLVVGQGSTSLPPHYGSEVFVQPIRFYYNSTGFTGFVRYGPEIPSAVVSQVALGGVTWLTLRPLGLLDVLGASYLVVVSYEARSSVSYSHV